MMSRSASLVSSAVLLTACFNPDPSPLSGTGDSSASGSAPSEAGGASLVTSVSASDTEQMSADGTSGGTTPTRPPGGSETTGDETTGRPTTDADTTMSIDPSETDTRGTTGNGSSSGGETTGGPSPCFPDGPLPYPGVNPQTIWIANSQQSTISRIDTTTMVEQARYQTHDAGAGNPSRTSVSLSGHVAVANRNGGLAKFYGDLDDCVDLNGNGVIDTSTGAADVRPWGTEECLAWFTAMNYTSQRPVAWTAGALNEDTCRYEGERVWTSGVVDDALIEVLRVDGETGVIEDSIPIPGLAPNFFGLYGGAVDAEGNFWASMLGIGTLVRVDAETLETRTWPMPANGYGMTVGASGYVFTCSNDVARFDPLTETWQIANGAGGGGGCAEDGEGRLWLASSPMVALDVATLTPAYSVELPEYVHGVSVDFNGNVWGVSLLQTTAYRVDPTTDVVDVFVGLTEPYTYSDMTGFALAAVAL